MPEDARLGGRMAEEAVEQSCVGAAIGKPQTASAVAPRPTELPVLSTETCGSSFPCSVRAAGNAVADTRTLSVMGGAVPRPPGVVTVVGPCLFSGLLFRLDSGAPVRRTRIGNEGAGRRRSSRLLVAVPASSPSSIRWGR